MAVAGERLYVSIDIDGGKAARALKNLDKNMAKTQRSAMSLQKSFSRLNGVIGILMGANMIGGLIKSSVQLVDTYNELGGRINLVAQDTVGLARAQEDLNRVAMDTYTAYDAVGSLYARLGMSTKELGATHEQLTQATQTVANTLRLSGASAQEARSSMLQLSQSMASGKLAGDEFRSISENNVALMDLLADSLDVTRGELKKMSSDGLLTTNKVFKALLENTDKYQKLVEGLPITVGRAMTNLETAWQALLVESSKAEEGITTVAESIDELAQVLNDPATRTAAAEFVAFFVNVAREAIAAAKWVWDFLKPVAKVISAAREIDQLNYQMGPESQEQQEYIEAMKEVNKYQDLYFRYFGKHRGATQRYGELLEIARKNLEGLRKEQEKTFSPRGFLATGIDLPALNLSSIPSTPDESKTEEAGKGKLTPLQQYRKGLIDAQAEADRLIPKLRILDELMFNDQISDSLWQDGVDALLGVKEAAEAAVPPLTAMDVALNDIDAVFTKLEEDHLQNEANGISGLGDKIDGANDSLMTMAEVTGGIVLDGIKGMSDAIVDFALTGEQSFADMTKSILADLTKMILQTQILNALKGTAFGGFLGLNADGNVFSGGNIQPFARGGIVNGPTLFPMANGMGLMGEAGPEAVMPLSRGSDGKLGVKAQGGGTNVNIINNSGGEATVTEQQNAQGGVDIQVLIEKSVDSYMSSGGANGLMGRTFGARPRPR